MGGINKIKTLLNKNLSRLYLAQIAIQDVIHNPTQIKIKQYAPSQAELSQASP